MNVKLIAHTKWAGDEHDTDIMAFCARVSNPQNQDNPNSEKLLQYCADNGHWSVFEMSNIVIEINTTRDIARQILRHRSFSFQEFSQRYANANELGKTVRKARFQDEKNRQNSIVIEEGNCQHNIINKEFRNAQNDVWDAAIKEYDRMINFGVAKEQARALLPEGLMNSRMYVNGTVRSWIHYCRSRTDKSTQKEHRDIAESCWSIISDLYPALNNQKD
jgi:thymidylate synthase (FAD)